MTIITGFILQTLFSFPKSCLLLVLLLLCGIYSESSVDGLFLLVKDVFFCLLALVGLTNVPLIDEQDSMQPPSTELPFCLVATISSNCFTSFMAGLKPLVFFNWDSDVGSSFSESHESSVLVKLFHFLKIHSSGLYDPQYDLKECVAKHLSQKPSSRQK